MSRSSSLVGSPRRRAASVARSGSAGIGASLGIIEIKFMAEKPYLSLDCDDHGEVPRIDQRVPGVLQRGEELQHFVEAVPNVSRWFSFARKRHDRSRVLAPMRSAMALVLSGMACA